MRIIATSDLHADFPSHKYSLMQHVDAIRSNIPDVLIVAGDLAGTENVAAECLGLFDGMEAQKLFVPGNHDTWVKSGNSYERLDKLRAIAKEHGWHPLDVKPYTVDDVAFVGSMGWYDYSFLPKEAPEQVSFVRNSIFQKTVGWEGLTPAMLSGNIRYIRPGVNGTYSFAWGDKLHTRWEKSDEAVLEEMNRELENQLKSCEAAEKVVAVTHHVPFEQFVVRERPEDERLDPTAWSLGNAYIGSKKMGELLLKYPNVKASVFGHGHVSGYKQIGHIDTYQVCFDSKNPNKVWMVEV